MVPFCSQIQPIYRRSRAEIYPCPSVEIFVPTCRGRRPDVPSARQRRAARLPPCGAVDASRRRRFSSQRWRSRAAILCVWQADSTQLGRKYTHARRRRFSSQRWRSRAAILCVWQADSTQLGRKYTHARRRRFSSQRWRSRAAILCVWQADSTQLGRKYTRRGLHPHGEEP